jgi:hypothetical protein
MYVMAASRRFVRLAVLGGIALAVLVLNPWFWKSLGLDYDFGTSELRAAVEGTWQLTVTPKDAPEEMVTFTLSQGSTVRQDHASRTLVRSADACGKRSLVKTARACLDTTTMPLEVRIADGAARGRVGSGQLHVDGTRFVEGALSIAIGEIFVDALVTPTGTVERVYGQRGGGELPSRLARIAR